MPTKKKTVIKKKRKTRGISKLFKNTHEGRCKHCTPTFQPPEQECRRSSSPCKLKHNDPHNKTAALLPRFNYTNNNLHFVKLNNPVKMNYKSQNQSSGLSPKEKHFLICSCQTRSRRYSQLKLLAANAMKENKIFSIYGSCSAVRKALLERGWVEKIPANRMNLSKIRSGAFANKIEVHGELERLLLSSLVEKATPNFIWRTRDEHQDTVIDMNPECTTIINKLKTDALWTSKQGLCLTMNSNYWFYIEDVAEVNAPRSYNSYDSGEIDAFIQDYKITACTSLLKWVLSMLANDMPVFVETGKISLNVIVFALNRCKEYLLMKQNKDIDRPVTNVNINQWNSFLKKYYLIIAHDEVFQADLENKLPLYSSYANFLLKEIHKYRPQISCEGCLDIWIIKPAHNSRGRGIRLASKLLVITNLLNKVNTKYVVQKYIEEPLLIYDTKFDIRQYCLVTSTYPLVIWMYQDSYLKFSSQKYTLKSYHESIHLTNNAVQRKYANCSGRHPELPTNNMWDSDKFKDYLHKKGRGKVWDNIIYPGMRKSIIAIMLSCQDSLSTSKHRFELYGCDFILDKSYNPWLIEINSCPDLNHTTLVTAKMCPAVVADIVKVVVDYPNDPNCSTGKFECIYRQPMTMPRYGQAADLCVRGYPLPEEYFYKGSIKFEDSFLDEMDIGKENNITAVLNNLKQCCKEDDVMMIPDEDSEFVSKKIEVRATESEYEVNAVATVINGQLDELLDRVASETTTAPKAAHPVPTVSSSQSATDIKNLMKKAIKKFASTQAVSVSQSFRFSSLDDGPLGKGSFVDIGSLKRAFIEFSKLNRNEKTEGVLEATAKMINFMNSKQKEYFSIDT